MQYILTSATLGAEDDNEGVAEFARNLCCSPFSSEDIVRASRIIPKKPAERCQLTTTFYRNIAELLNQDASDEKLLCELRKYNS